MTECLIVSARADEYVAELAKYDDFSSAVTASHSSADALQNYHGQKIVFGDPDLVASILPQLPTVEWVQSTWAGVLPFMRAERRDYLLTGVKDVFGPQMSEFVIGYLLAHELRILERERAQRGQQWLATSSGTLSGKQIGIMGTGSIGEHIAQTAAGFGMQVRGLSLSGKARQGFQSVFPIARIDEFLQQTNYLVAALPQTPGTDNLLNADTLAQLPDKAYFINVGRSNVVDDSALLEALQSGALSGAVLDVFDEEPLPPASPFWSAPNLRVTAHISAQSHPSLVVPIFVENLRRYRQHEQLNYVIDFGAGY
jgi:phosphoglycerate dehydrogenase-like enzyme